MVLKSSNHSIAIVIPMYNEEKGAEICVSKVVVNMKKLDVPVELIVVNDGSIDDTDNILTLLSKKYPKFLNIITHDDNQGYGAGLITGIKYASKHKFSHCLFMDSDLTNDPKDIVLFSKKMNFDCVKASRYVKDGGMKKVPINRQIVSYISLIVCNLCFRMKIRDYTNGFRMVRTSLLDLIPYTQDGFSIILEEMYYLKKFGARCSEIPVTLTARTDTESNFSYTPMIFWHYLRYALMACVLG